MSVLKMAAEPKTPTRRTDAPDLADSWQARTASATAHWGRSGAVITVDGELDAANAGQFADFVQRCDRYCRWLVLDLDDLDFIGTAGFAVLQGINKRCSDASTYWSLVPGTAVSRLLQVCDRDKSLPTSVSVAAALAATQAYRKLG